MFHNGNNLSIIQIHLHFLLKKKPSKCLIDPEKKEIAR